MMYAARRFVFLFQKSKEQSCWNYSEKDARHQFGKEIHKLELTSVPPWRAHQKGGRASGGEPM